MAAEFPGSPHSSVISSGRTVKAGGVTSSIVMVASHSVSLPQASVAVKVTVIIPSQSNIGSAGKSLVIVTSEQLSSPLARPNHNSITLSFRTSPHSKVISEGHDMVGATVSSTLKAAAVVAVFPHSSVAVKVTFTEGAPEQPVVAPPTNS